MIFFDFLFYNIYRFYSRHKEKGAESSSAGIIGGLQTVNLLILYELILLIQANNGKMRISFVIALLAFFKSILTSGIFIKSQILFKYLRKNG